jgi:hypothetical protein
MRVRIPRSSRYSYQVLIHLVFSLHTVAEIWNFNKNPSSLNGVVPYGWVGEQADMTKLGVAFHLVTKAS